MLAAAKKLENKLLFLRLNQTPNAEEAVPNNVQCKRVCCVFAQRKTKIEASSSQELEDINPAVAAIEVINMVEKLLFCKSPLTLCLI